MSTDRKSSEADGLLPHFRRLRSVAPDDFITCRMMLPTSILLQLEAQRRRHHLRGRDAIVAALVRRARTQFNLEDFQLPAEPAEGDIMQSVKVTLQAEHVSFLYRLQRRFRGASLGCTIEAILETVQDVPTAPEARV